MIGETISHYRIDAELGRGGMGVVCRAEDLRLKRSVALKFLPEERCSDRAAVARFQREAQAASALNHPHICTIYDIDEHQRRHFIAMELLEGQTLDTRMRERQSDANEILTWAIQIADALVAAHAEQIIHRDIKPANIFITQRGDAKILDFGLAKLLREAGPVGDTCEGATVSVAPTDLHTRAGTVAGTIAYMSPEQSLGLELDTRSDLFSFGVVLYQMATGQLPFCGDTPAALFDEILHKEVDAPQVLNSALPDGLGGIIGKALQKDRALRYQSASDLLADLRHVSRVRSSPQTLAPVTVDPSRIRSVAVLPFTDMSREQDQEHFCDGIAEELITSLARIRELRVPARTSSFSFKGKNADVREIGRTLNVGAVIQGSVRKAGHRLRIAAQLVDVADGYHV